MWEVIFDESFYMSLPTTADVVHPFLSSTVAPAAVTARIDVDNGVDSSS
jgi:hypothetical protein